MSGGVWFPSATVQSEANSFQVFQVKHQKPGPATTSSKHFVPMVRVRLFGRSSALGPSRQGRGRVLAPPLSAADPPDIPARHLAVPQFPQL